MCRGCLDFDCYLLWAIVIQSEVEALEVQLLKTWSAHAGAKKRKEDAMRKKERAVEMDEKTGEFTPYEYMMDGCTE